MRSSLFHQQMLTSFMFVVALNIGKPIKFHLLFVVMQFCERTASMDRSTILTNYQHAVAKLV